MSGLIKKLFLPGLSSSLETLSEPMDDIPEPQPEKIEREQSSSSESDDFNFYKPDMSTPPRFKPSYAEFEGSESSDSIEFHEPEERGSTNESEAEGKN